MFVDEVGLSVLARLKEAVFSIVVVTIINHHTSWARHFARWMQ